VAHSVVVDTDVCSFVFKGDSRADPYRTYFQNTTAALAFQTVAELYQWAEVSQWGAQRRASLEAWLQAFVIVAYDLETGRLWARIRAERQRKGHPISTADAWVAACALRYGGHLVTHNAADFAGISGLIVITTSSP
jgi:predicted nucleic acid-binding protein